MIYVSISSIGYLFTTLVAWVSFFRLTKSYKKSHTEETRLMYMFLFFLGLAALLYSAPTFFFSDAPHILGWFNVIANICMGIFISYLLRFSIRLHFSERNANNVFKIMIFWSLTVLPIINIIFLPEPYFNKYTLEIWNYHPLLWIHTGFVLFVVFLFTGSSILYRYIKDGGKGSVAIPLSVSLSIGAFGSAIVTYTVSNELLLIGYILLFFGGVTIFSFSFLK